MTYYGPQDQESVGQHSLAIVVQFGGPSGNGYMSRRQMSDSFAKLENQGRFEPQRRFGPGIAGAALDMDPRGRSGL